MVAFITKVISIPVLAVLGKINVDLVFTLVTEVTNVRVRPSVCLSVCTELPDPYETDVCEIPYRGVLLKLVHTCQLWPQSDTRKMVYIKPDRIYDCFGC